MISALCWNNRKSLINHTDETLVMDLLKMIVKGETQGLFSFKTFLNSL